MNALLNFKGLSLLIVALGLVACSTNTDYLEASSIPPIEVPDGADKSRLGELYPVPLDANKRTPRKFSVPFPPTVGVQDDANIASVQTMGDTLWVLNTRSPAATWTQLNAFWQQQQVALTERDLNSATMTTAWFDKTVQPGYQVRYRLRLEQGLQPDTTDIFIYNETAAIEQPSTNTVVQSLGDVAHARVLAEKIVTAFNNPSSRIGESFLAATINLPQKVRLSEVDDEPVLLSIADEERLNRALLAAFEQEGFRFFERNTEARVYYFAEQKRSRSKSKLSVNTSGMGDFLWDYLFGGINQVQVSSLDDILRYLPDEPAVNALFPDVDSRETAENILGGKGYLLVLRPYEKQTAIYIRNIRGRPLDVEKAVTVLDNIRLRLF